MEEMDSEIEKSEVGIDAARVGRRKRRNPHTNCRDMVRDSGEIFNRASHSR